MRTYEILRAFSALNIVCSETKKDQVGRTWRTHVRDEAHLPIVVRKPEETEA